MSEINDGGKGRGLEGRGGNGHSCGEGRDTEGKGRNRHSKKEWVVRDLLWRMGGK